MYAIIHTGIQTLFALVTQRYLATALRFIRQLEPFVKTHRDSLMLSNVINYYVICATAFFITGDHRKSLKYVLSALEVPDHQLREDQRVYVRLLHLLIHFEMGNLIELESRVKAVNKFMQQQRSGFKLETLVVDFMQREVLKLGYSEELKEAFISLKEKVDELKADPIESYAFVYFPWSDWIDSKIKDVPLGELIIKKE